MLKLRVVVLSLLHTDDLGLPLEICGCNTGEPVTQVLKFAKKHNMKYNVICTDDQITSRSYPSPGIPNAFIVVTEGDCSPGQGRIAWKGNPLDYEGFESGLQEALKQCSDDSKTCTGCTPLGKANKMKQNMYTCTQCTNKSPFCVWCAKNVHAGHTVTFEGYSKSRCLTKPAKVEHAHQQWGDVSRE